PAVRDGTATARGGEVGVALNAAHFEPTATPMTVITRAMATKAGTANDRRRCTRGYCQSRSRGLGLGVDCFGAGPGTLAARMGRRRPERRNAPSGRADGA